jgi:choline dehydrogenase
VIFQADYVVIGAGTAGCVLAGRLAANATVILLEAGGDSSSLRLKVPAGVIRLMGNPRFDWCLTSAPDASRGGRVIHWAAGKTVGGSGAINGMAFNRGLARDYEKWLAAGCSGWGAADVAPFFRDMECFDAAGSAADAAGNRGSHGPQAVEFNRFRCRSTRIFLEGCAQAGILRVDDVNGFPSCGAGLTQTNTRFGRRMSARESFLRPAQRSGRLQLFTHSVCRRLLFESRRCVGATFRRDGTDHQARARREVIVTAGALATPKLLLLSGLGPMRELEDLGIPVVADLPGVGDNLQDHAGVGMSISGRVDGICARDAAGWRTAVHGLNWWLRGRGPAAGGPILATAYGCSGDDGTPDVHLQFMALTLRDGGLGLGATPGMTVIVSCCEPRSRGRLKLRSAEPEETVDARLELLGDPLDVSTLVRGLKLVRRIVASPSLRAVDALEQLPGPARNSDAGLADYCREAAGSQYHPAGTCRMGGEDAVVDPALKVRGVGCLRIADASVMPALTSANTNAPVMMIAERAAHWLRGEERA